MRGPLGWAWVAAHHKMHTLTGPIENGLIARGIAQAVRVPKGGLRSSLEGWQSAFRHESRRCSLDERHDTMVGSIAAVLTFVNSTRRRMARPPSIPAPPTRPFHGLRGLTSRRRP